MDNPLNNTFPTEIDFAIPEENPNQDAIPSPLKFSSSLNNSLGNGQSPVASVPKLPNAVNFVALRESLLSEAPFVTSKNKYFWRRCVNSRFFQNILSSSFHFLMGCIGDNTSIDLEKMNEIKNKTHLTSCMATNLAEMYFVMKLRERDIFFSRLPEVIGFMVVNALLTSSPKHHRLFNSIKFREILLDWSTEVIGGIRFSNCHTDREWYFADSIDSPITIISIPQKTKKKIHKIDGITSAKVSVELSPLIQMYVSSLNRVEQPLRVTLSQLPERPLTTLGTFIPHSVRIRRKKIDMDQVQQVVNESTEKRHHIMDEFTLSAQESEKDMKTLRQQLRNDIKKMSSELNESIDFAKKESKLKKEEWKSSMKQLLKSASESSAGNRL